MQAKQPGVFPLKRNFLPIMVHLLASIEPTQALWKALDQLSFRFLF
jgi:hypothetical protein